MQVTGLALSTFYFQRQALQRADRHTDIKARICAVYNEHKGRYAYRRIAAALCNFMAQSVNYKRAQRLLQEMGLRSLICAKRYGKAPRIRSRLLNTSGGVSPR